MRFANARLALYLGRNRSISMKKNIKTGRFVSTPPEGADAADALKRATPTG
jgi:hypothetical protein